MTKITTNFISLLLGGAFIYLFIWLTGIVAAIPVPEFLQPYTQFVVSYYSNILIALLSASFSLIIMFAVRQLFTFFTKQNLLYFSVPIILYLSYLAIFFNLLVAPLIVAAIPSLLVTALLINQETNDQPL